LGLLGESGATVTVDLVDSPVFAVFGPERSGRTTALTTLVLGLHENVPTARFFLASPRRSQLLDLDLWEQAGRGVDGADSMLVELAAEIRDRGADTKDVVVLVVDDGEEMTDGAGASALTDIIKRSRDAGVIVLAAVSTSAAHRSFGGWVSDLKRQRHAVALCPDIDVDGDLLGVRFPRKSSRRYPPGRGYAVSRGGCDYVQVAES
jgi:S-DNA-T family DNA segregation ATPase FtsK/SpoIIIE